MGMRGTRGGTPTKPKHTEESIQQALYWNHPILTKPAFEMVGFIFYAWESDYLAISKAGYVYECEIKISHSDFLNEAIHKQNKMRILQGLSASDGTIDDRRPNYFCFLTFHSSVMFWTKSSFVAHLSGSNAQAPVS